MREIKELTDKILEFRKERDWEQFHTPKDLAISLSLEAAEVLEHFQWKTNDEIKEYIKNNKEHIGEELADVFYWILIMSHDIDIDIVEAFNQKMKKNAEKYSVEKSKGKHTKYNKL